MSDTDTSIPKIRSDKRVPYLDDDTATFTIDPDDSTLSPAPGPAFKTHGATALAPVIQIDRLYDTAPGSTSQIVTVLELLKQADDNLAEARKADNPIEADRLVQRVQISLPKLFACRSIGDGFGVIINAVHFAFTNLSGKPLTSVQLNVIWRVLRELRARPALSLEQGIQRVEELEGCGLEVDPPDLDDLLEDFDLAENE
jgi:hypothetical protein